MCKDCVQKSIVSNAQKVLGLDISHLSYAEIEVASKQIGAILKERNINVNDHRAECVDLFKQVFKEATQKEKE